MKTITKDEFVKIYNSKTSKELSKELGVSRITLRNWAKKFGLPSKRKSLIKK